VEWNHSQIT